MTTTPPGPVFGDTTPWLKRFRRGRAADVRLFCFHHAGGTAAIYRDWAALLPPSVEPIAVQLPGRADRFRERAIDSMPTLVDALVPVLTHWTDGPFAFYGLSMGAKIAWTLTRHLRDLRLPLPCALYLASAAAPGVEEGRLEWQEDLVGYLRDMGGTPPEVLAEPDLIGALLPTLRADLTLVDTYRPPPAEPLDIPVLAFAGVDDAEGSPERMLGWQRETRAGFRLQPVRGGHFFDEAGEREVVRTVVAHLLLQVSRRPLGNGRRSATA